MAYLVYLAVRQWRTASVDLREQVGKAMDGGRVALLVRGFLVNATNPKGLVFFLAVLPQFVVPTEPLLPQYLAVGVTMVVVDLVVMGLYTGLSVRLVRGCTRRASRPSSTACSPGCSPRRPSCFRLCGAVRLPSDQVGQLLDARARQPLQSRRPSGQQQQKRLDRSAHFGPVTRRPVDIRRDEPEPLERTLHTERPAHRPDPLNARPRGIFRHLPLDAQRNRDVLTVHEDVEQDVAVVRHLRQPARRRMLASSATRSHWAARHDGPTRHG